MNDALLELVYGDPLNAWEDILVLELPEMLRLGGALRHRGRNRKRTARRRSSWKRV